MSALVLLAAAAIQATPVAAASTQSQPAFERVATLQVDFEVAGHRVFDASGDGLAEIVVFGVDGRVKSFVRDGERGFPSGEPRGELVLADPARTLLDLAEFEQAGAATVLVALSSQGTVAYRAGEDGVFDPRPWTLAPRARFQVRVGSPYFADFTDDVNADGRPDLIVPAGDRLELWTQLALAEEDASSAGSNGSSGSDAPRQLARFQRSAQIAADVSRGVARSANELSDVLESSFSIPRLSVRDVDGDGKPDLHVQEGSLRAWHLQKDDGSFASTPDVSVDLSLFRDTTESARVRPGHTLALEDDATLEPRDLDGDGVQDHVIAHRRKVWVFPGGKDGPQFQTPSAILKTADDITALALVALDDDERVDLLLVRVQVPTIATLIRGMFGEWDVEIGASGYRNVDGRSFETSPSAKSSLVVRVPAILDLVKDPEQFLRRFEAAARRLRGGSIGDFDGDGRVDLVLLSEDRSRADLWRGTETPSALETRTTIDRAMRKVLFEDTETTWDVDRIAEAFASFAQRRAAGLTGGRPPERSFALRDAREFGLVAVERADLDGDGRDELLISYRPRASIDRRLFDVLELAR